MAASSAYTSSPAAVSIRLFCWYVLIHLQVHVACAFYASQPTITNIVPQPAAAAAELINRSRRCNGSSNGNGPLYGIAEWRAKFSPPPSETASNINTDDSTLPLLLLPHTPHQILLPGQSTTLQFRHGRYIDMIDESMENHESVLGMSLLDEDGLLPHVVVCEVLEEELDMKMGYRGFSSMEVGVRAVGRAKRVDVNVSKGGNDGDDGDGSDIFSIFQDNKRRSRTALDEIHLGQFVEWQDDPLDDDHLETAKECLENIEGLLLLSSQKQQRQQQQPDLLDDGIQRQQMLYTEAYKAMLQTTLSTDSERTEGHNCHAHLVASSWAAFAAAQNNGNDSSSRSSPLLPSSVITQALATTNTAERLRLGLAALLESQTRMMSLTTDYTSDDRNVKNSAAGKSKEKYNVRVCSGNDALLDSTQGSDVFQ